MKRWVLFVILVLLVSCKNNMPKAYSDTKVGRTKKNYYNAVEFGDRDGKAARQKKFNKTLKKQERKRRR